jgi:hypothetical protein
MITYVGLFKLPYIHLKNGDKIPCVAYGSTIEVINNKLGIFNVEQAEWGDNIVLQWYLFTKEDILSGEFDI